MCGNSGSYSSVPSASHSRAPSPGVGEKQEEQASKRRATTKGSYDSTDRALLEQVEDPSASFAPMTPLSEGKRSCSASVSTVGHFSPPSQRDGSAPSACAGGLLSLGSATLTPGPSSQNVQCFQAN